MSTKKWTSRYPERLQLYTMATPNGQKVSIALEELQLPYETHRVDIMAGEQFLDEYRAISPNGKIPVLIDPAGPGGKPLVLMESGAILLYLAEKTGKLLPTSVERFAYLPWLFFQVGHIGPIFGQFGHFYRFAKDKCEHPYPLERYRSEAVRLLQVLEERLSTSAYVGGPLFSIVDIAIAPWVDCLGGFYQAAEVLQLAELPYVQNWLQRCKSRESYTIGSKIG